MIDMKTHFELPLVDVELPFFFIQNLESSNSPAQDAVLLVFARIVEDQIRNGFHPPSTAESPVTARLLIAPSTVNLVTGNEGEVISELREVSGADIQLLVGEPIPDVTSDNDVVVQVQLYNSRQLCFLKGS
jgi:poly(rC)-binding protein 2/3/4